MEVIGILLAVLAMIGLVAWLLDRWRLSSPNPSGQAEARPYEEGGQDGACDTPEPGCTDEDCAVRDTCPALELLTAQVSEAGGVAPLYFEDEELDAYRGRSADGYTDDELEQWRDVLYTLRPGDLLPWQHSIESRGIVMPTVIRLELVDLLAQSSTTLNKQ